MSFAGAGFKKQPVGAGDPFVYPDPGVVLCRSGVQEKPVRAGDPFIYLDPRIVSDVVGYFEGDLEIIGVKAARPDFFEGDVFVFIMDKA